MTTPMSQVTPPSSRALLLYACAERTSPFYPFHFFVFVWQPEMPLDAGHDGRESAPATIPSNGRENHRGLLRKEGHPVHRGGRGQHLRLPPEEILGSGKEVFQLTPFINEGEEQEVAPPTSANAK